MRKQSAMPAAADLLQKAYSDQINQTHEQALEALFREHSSWLKTQATRMVGHHMSDDLVQETFIRASKYYPELSFRYPRSLLAKIAKNLVRSSRRKTEFIQRSICSNELEIEEIAFCPSQYESLLIKQIVLALPEIYRDVFLLSRFDGMSYEQIAEARGISVKTVEWRMSRALAMCAARMRE